jgi:hypothetical protein
MCEIDPGTHKGMHSVLLLKTGCDNYVCNCEDGTFWLEIQRTTNPESQNQHCFFPPV